MYRGFKINWEAASWVPLCSGDFRVNEEGGPKIEFLTKAKWERSRGNASEGSSSQSETSGRDDDPLTTLWNSDSLMSLLTVTRDDSDSSDSALLGKSALASWSDTAASETSPCGALLKYFRRLMSILLDPTTSH